MNITQIKDLRNTYLQLRADNPGFLGINFGEGEIQLTGVTAMLEIAPLANWKRKQDETHAFYCLDLDDIHWTVCFPHAQDPAPLPAPEGERVRFAAGEVEYDGLPEVAQTEADGSLYF